MTAGSQCLYRKVRRKARYRHQPPAVRGKLGDTGCLFEKM